MTLSTDFMGIPISSPVIAAASNLTQEISSIKKLEESGVGAIVLKSVFEEEIQLERFQMDDEMERTMGRHPMMVTVFPEANHPGVKTRLTFIREASDAVSIPVIGSLNAVTEEAWVEYAQEIASAGVDGLELNFYSIPVKLDQAAAEIEDEQIRIVSEVRKRVSVPIAVKLSNSYTNPLNFIKRLDQTGIDAVVLFNRFFQPDLDIYNEEQIFPMKLSSPNDQGPAMRYTGLLSGNINASIIAGGGIETGADVAKLLLCGADAVEVAGAFYKKGLRYASSMNRELESWMEHKGYNSIEDFKGKMNREHSKDHWAFTRAQYSRMLLKKNPLEAD